MSRCYLCGCGKPLYLCQCVCDESITCISPKKRVLTIDGKVLAPNLHIQPDQQISDIQSQVKDKLLTSNDIIDSNLVYVCNICGKSICSNIINNKSTVPSHDCKLKIIKRSVE